MFAVSCLQLLHCRHNIAHRSAVPQFFCVLPATALLEIQHSLQFARLILFLRPSCSSTPTHSTPFRVCPVSMVSAPCLELLPADLTRPIISRVPFAAAAPVQSYQDLQFARLLFFMQPCLHLLPCRSNTTYSFTSPNCLCALPAAEPLQTQHVPQFVNSLLFPHFVCHCAHADQTRSRDCP